MIAVGGVLALASLLGAPLGAHASSHREAPLIAADPQVDNTDLYAFVSPDSPDSVTLIANWIPFEDPNGGPNFYSFAPDAHYDINIDNTGGATASITYRWTFTNHYRSPDTFLYNTGPVNALTDPTLNFYQTYKLEKIVGGAAPVTVMDNIPAAPSDVGLASMPNYAALRDQAITALPGGGKTFAGQADDPFFLDLRIFDLLYGANLKEAGHDSLAGYNVHTIALQVPKTELAMGGDASNIIGVWSTTERQSFTLNADGTHTANGNFVQVSRLGNPLVNEVVVPVGAKNLFNASQPKDDKQFAPGVLDPEVPKLINSIYKIPAPTAPRDDLVAVFLTGVKGLNMPPSVTASEELRLNMSIPPTASPNRLGVVGGDKAGFPNGRRLTDDVVDIALQAVEGVLRPGHPAAVDKLGDGVNANDVAFGTSFPYLALPHTAAVNASGAVPAATTAPAQTPTNTSTSSGVSTVWIVLGALGVLVVGIGIGSLVRARRRA
jgi:cell division septation protein DedD